MIKKTSRHIISLSYKKREKSYKFPQKRTVTSKEERIILASDCLFTTLYATIQKTADQREKRTVWKLTQEIVWNCMEIDLYFQFTQSCKITQEYVTSFFYLVTKQIKVSISMGKGQENTKSQENGKRDHPPNQSILPAPEYTKPREAHPSDC